MKNYQIILFVFLITITSCGVSNTSSTTQHAKDSTLDVNRAWNSENGIYGAMEIKDTITIGDRVQLKFTVWNSADTASRFLKWSTPFEPLVSKYLEITHEDGTSIDYRGAMVKRAMPPADNSYIKLNPREKLVTDVNLLEGYAITRSARYKIVYVSSGMSGIIVKDSVFFVYR